MATVTSEPDQGPKRVTSVRGTRYVLGSELGRGGQGAVFAVDGEQLAVKLLADSSATRLDALRRQLAEVGRLPLDGLPIARPIEQLRPPDVGYVMERLTGMQPLRALLCPPQGTTGVSSWYAGSGGLRRRLRLCAHLADVMAQLHGRGLVYVDPSPANVFVSEDLGRYEVRLIDADNLRPSTTPGQVLYTPPYGAPEIVRDGRPASSLSDAHAFAVMAFETLALVHPLIGDLVNDGEPELEDEALAGGLPWIDDPEDDRNRASHGLPRDLVLSRSLRADFQQAFGPGLRAPALRPGMSRWAEHLHRAADRTLTCPSCTSSYFSDKAQCPWCHAPRPTFVMVALLLWDPGRVRYSQSGDAQASPGLVREPDGARHRVVDAMALSQGEALELPDRITHGTTLSSPRLRIELAGRRITIQRLDDGPWRLVDPDGHERLLGNGPVAMALRDSGGAWTVHAGPASRLHRVLRFDLHPGALP